MKKTWKQAWTLLVTSCALGVAGVAATTYGQEAQPQERQTQQEQKQAEKAGQNAAKAGQNAATKAAESRGREQQQSGQDQKKSDAPALKVVKLQKISAAAVQQLMQLRATPHMAAYGGTLDARSAPPGFPGSGFAAGPQPAARVVRAAADSRTNTIFLRGPQKEVERVAEMISSFDKSPEELSDGLTISENCFATPTKHLDPQQASVILQQLGFNAQATKLGEHQFVVLRHDTSEALDQARQVLQAIDQQPPSEQEEQKQDKQKDAEQEPAEHQDAE